MRTIDYPREGEEPRLRTLWTAAFGEEGFWRTFLTGVFRRDHCRCVYADGEIAAALYWFDCSLGEKKLAYLYAVATDEKYRQRGMCRSLLQNTHDLLRQQGYAAAVLVPEGERLRGMYAKMGYTDCGTVETFSCDSGGAAPNLRRIDGTEYGIARRNMLPEGSVLQEGDNLTHLAAMAELWAGDSILLSAYRVGENLHVQEYLGNASAAPGVVRTLGCARGFFRMSGGKEPFAMICPLNGEKTEFSYFGLAFD